MNEILKVTSKPLSQICIKNILKREQNGFVRDLHDAVLSIRGFNVFLDPVVVSNIKSKWENSFQKESRYAKMVEETLEPFNLSGDEFIELITNQKD